MKNVLIVYRLIVLLALILLQAWQVNAAYRDTNDFCKGAPCHTGTAGTTEGVPLSETDDKVHDSCIDCHDPSSGSLVGSAAGREGHEVNMCIDCHGGPARFLSHQHHENLNKVSYDDGVNDTSQPGQQGCEDCHGSGPQGGPYSLASWSDILFVHNNSCYTCHDYANEPSVGDNTPFLADVQFAIANPGSGVTCATCHKPKVPDTSHGSHGVSDFVRTPNCTTECHPSPDGIGEMHVTLRGDCGSCHQSAGGGGPLVASITGATTSSSCADCHGSSDPQTVHHGGASVLAGDCTACHADPRPIPAGMAHAPYQLSCGACHVSVTGDTVTVSSITRGIAGSTANGMPSGNVKTPLSTHIFTITSGTGAAKIVNYGACFYCHGATGLAAGRAPTGPTPFHGDIGYAGLGGTIAEGQNQFRVAEGLIDGSFGDSPTGTQAYWGPGRGVFNMNHAEYSIHDHYLQGQVGWQNNFGGETDTFPANAANIPRMYTFFKMYSTNLGANVVIPVFDTDYIAGTQCSGSCDTVTINTNRVSSGGTGIVNRVLTVKASSTDSSAQLTVVHGGEATPMSCSSGNCSATIDYSGYPANVHFDASDINLDSVWVISDKGGSARYENINTR